MNALNLVEISADEARTIDGGAFPLLVYMAYAAGAGLTAGITIGVAALQDK